MSLDPDEEKAPRTAVALGYDPETDAAPRVLASGQGAVAEGIIDLAKKHRIPIREDKILVTALASLELDSVIPAELYRLVAEVFAYIYRVWERGKRR